MADTTGVPHANGTTPTTTSTPEQQTTKEEPTLNIPRHITYWQRCLKTYLPPLYTSMDANRMMLAYFTFLSLDLLGALDLSPEERQNALDWVYLCQHHEGGFRGSPGVDLDGREAAGNKSWDGASVPATFFALSILAILRDDFARVRRKECLSWLRRVQRKDGSFGEHLGENGVVEGGMDTRFGFCAAGVRWMLRGGAVGDVEGVEDIDTDALIECIRVAQTFDGGISEMPFHEPHGGYTYCALACLSLIGGLPSPLSNQPHSKPTGLTDINHTTRWLLSRQTAQLHLHSDEDYDSEAEDEDLSNPPRLPNWAGFNGRPNKPADTCYAFWVGGSLSILGKDHLMNKELSRKYLLEKTQHRVGGFGKKAGDVPDVYHSALGLAALGVMGEKGVGGVDARLCLGVESVRWVEGLGWRREIEREGKQRKEGTLET